MGLGPDDEVDWGVTDDGAGCVNRVQELFDLVKFDSPATLEALDGTELVDPGARRRALRFIFGVCHQS